MLYVNFLNDLQFVTKVKMGVVDIEFICRNMFIHFFNFLIITSIYFPKTNIPSNRLNAYQMVPLKLNGELEV